MFNIKFNHKLESFVAGFSRSNQAVTITFDKAYAKVFKSKKAATQFIDTYSNAGYGMDRNDVAVIEA